MDATISAEDTLQMSSWNRERTIDELRSFVETRFASLPDHDDVE